MIKKLVFLLVVTLSISSLFMGNTYVEAKNKDDKIEKPTKQQKEEIKKQTKNALKDFSIKDDTNKKLKKWKIKNEKKDDKILWTAKVKSKKNKKIVAIFSWDGKDDNKPILNSLFVNRKDLVEEKKHKEEKDKKEKDKKAKKEEQENTEKQKKEDLEAMLPSFNDSITKLVDESNGILISVNPTDELYNGVDIIVSQDIKYSDEGTKKQIMDFLGKEIQNRVGGFLTSGETPFVVFKYSETGEQLGISKLFDISTFNLTDK